MKLLTFLMMFFFQTLLMAEQAIPVVVIGSGPAGLSAALVSGRERVETHVFCGDILGGPANAITCMSNWPGSIEGKGNIVMQRLFEQIEKYKVTLHHQTIERVDFSTWPFKVFNMDGNQYDAKTVIIATGAIPRGLQIPGEAEYLRKGIETSIYKPDAPRFKGKAVAIVGGGLDAIKKATILSKSAERVYLLVRQNKMQKPFMEKFVLDKGHGKVLILYQTTVSEILGDSSKITHLKLASPEGERKLNVDSLVLATGLIPNTSLFQGQIHLDAQGFIVLEGRTQRTNVPGVFAAGNATDPSYRQAGISAGDGMKAGYDALEFLEKVKN